jgi:two-component system response regulator MprA
MTSAAPSPSTPLAAVTMPLRILLADDEDALRASLTRLLEQLGHHVTAVSNGAAALSLFGVQPLAFDVALLDIDMPHNGFHTLRALRSTASPIFIILMSASAFHQADHPDTTPDAFLRKPFSLTTLVNTLQSIPHRLEP